MSESEYTELPEDWELPDEWREWTDEWRTGEFKKWPCEVQIDHLIEEEKVKFKNFYINKSIKKKDWFKAWKFWISYEIDKKEFPREKDKRLKNQRLECLKLSTTLLENFLQIRFSPDELYETGEKGETGISMVMKTILDVSDILMNYIEGDM